MNPLLAWRVWRYKRAVLALWKEGKRGKWRAEGLTEQEIRRRLKVYKVGSLLKILFRQRAIKQEHPEVVLRRGKHKAKGKPKRKIKRTPERKCDCGNERIPKFPICYGCYIEKCNKQGEYVHHA